MLGIRFNQGVAIDLYEGDISHFYCDMMANAANRELQGGGGVDGAIHRVGGPELLEVCRPLAPCEIGQAVVTKATGQLPCAFVIHAVGPVWQGGDHQEAQYLASAYRSIFRKAMELNLRHLALPSISTGAYAYPLQAAAEIAILSLKDFFSSDFSSSSSALKRITFVLYTGDIYLEFQKCLFNHFADSPDNK